MMEQAAVLKTVSAALDAAANNKPGKLESVFANNAVILDDAPPFTWTGKNSSLHWLSDIHKMVNTYAYKPKTPTAVLVAGSRAYVTLPIHFTAHFTQHGKKMTETDDGTWLLVLQKSGKNWMVTGAAWASAKMKL